MCALKEKAMSHIFISHVEEDADLAREIADSLESAGYNTWYYERDTVPGASYLIQVTQAIDQCQAVVLLVSSNSISSSQVTREVVHAFEKDKRFFPVLHGISHTEFQERQPEWRHALGSSASISIGPEGAPACTSRLVNGLMTLDIHPVTDQTRIATAETAPASYTPRHLADRIIAARPSIEGERKQVTVLIGDVTGFTSSAGEIDPEEEHDMIRQCLGFFADEIHRYEGTITQLQGDGVIALFGAPIAHEYAPQRAIYAALGIQQRLKRYAEELGNKGIEFETRIGVNTGPVVIGKIRDDLTLEYTPVGDTLSLASRMKGLAEPDTIQVSENTFGLTEDYFEFRPCGDVQVKGEKESIKIYQVLGLGEARTRLRAAMAHGLTPFVGRERELELLMDGFERAKEGSGQALSIMGEAGVGKSRLLHEFRNALANENITFLEGRCLVYSRGEAYHPIIDTLKSNFDIREGDSDERIREKVRSGLKLVEVEEEKTLPYFLELLSVKDSGIDTISMSPEARKERTMEALKWLVLSGSEIRPLVIAIEDLHWVDKSTEDTVKHLLDSISGARVLMISTYRPDYIFTWGGRSYHSQITLNRLSNRESMVMISHLLGTDNIEKDLQDLILQKTEGIPFFIEEFIRSLKDLGMIESRDNMYCLIKDIRDLAIPGTIQEVIMARVDSLPDAAKEVLQTGSAIEREFSYELIRRVTGIPELELVSHLSVLRDSELIYERGIFPQSTYVFKHALTREVVYDPLLTSRKKRLHVEIGDAIEEIHRDDLQEHYEALAEHYIAGEQYEKSAEYCRLAARKARRKASFNDAIAYGKKRVACLEELPQTEDVQRKIVDERTSVGLNYNHMNRHIEAKEAVAPVVDLAVNLNYERRISQIYTILGCYCFAEEDFPKAVKYLENALNLSEKINDILSFSLASFWLGLALAVSCEYERALYNIEKSMEISAATNVLWGMTLNKCAIGVFIYDLQGSLVQGHSSSNEAIKIAEESGDIWSKAHAYTCHGFSCYCKGQLQEAGIYLLKGIDLCESIDLRAYHVLGLVWLGCTYTDMGEQEKSRDCFNKAISLHRQYSSFPSWRNLCSIALVRAKVIDNEMDIDLSEIYKCRDDNRIEALNGWMSGYIGDILLNIHEEQISEAEDWIKKAIEVNTKNGMRWHLAKDYVSYADLFQHKGDLPKAKEKLTKAIDIFRECGADGWVERYEEEVAKL
jgi:class 3 adenylate cyclase/tetratricopeptide (TPR) repeat protein